MSLKGSVRLKTVVCLCLMAVIVYAAPTADERFAQQERIEQERSEKEWADTMVAKANGLNESSTSTEKATTTTTTKTSGSGEKRVENKLTCQYYDKTECEMEGKCELRDEICTEDMHLTTLGCMAVYALPNDTKAIDPSLEKMDMKYVLRQGCMQYPPDGLHGCEKEQCRQERVLPRHLGSCCCMTDNCNTEVFFTDTKIDLSKSSALVISQGEHLEVVESVFPPLWTLVVALVLMSLLACCLVACVACRKKETKKFNVVKTTTTLETGPLVEHEQHELVETTKQLPISDFQLICNGRFGTVFKATWTDKEDTYEKTYDVAVKKVGEANFNHEKKIYDELRALGKWYPSILKVHRSEKIGKEYWIVTEFHERQSLFDLLLNHEISISTCYRLALSMIDGLQFLHDDRPYYFGETKRPIIHRDIKSKNILVRKDLTACIADFGLACIYDFDVQQLGLLGQVGTRRYMAPEVLQGAAEFTPSAFKAMDVYSMGLVLWEVISRTKLGPDDVVPKYEVPYQLIGANPAIGYMRNHVVNQKQRPEFRAKVRADERVDRLAVVAEDMWHAEATGRITAGCAFAKVWEIVQSSRDGSEGYGSGQEVGETEDVDEMANYHESPTTRAHPSPDPFRDMCPPPPPVPGLSYENKDILYSEEAIGTSLPSHSLACGSEKVFDLETNRLLSPEELAFRELDKKRFYDRGGGETDTPTPSGTFGF